MSLPHADLAEAWAAARPDPSVRHLDHAACSRQSTAVLRAVVTHLRLEAEAGGYAVEEAAAPVIAAGRTGLARLLGLTADDVGFAESAQAALDRLLSCWPGLGPGTRVAVTRSEFGPTAAWLVDHGALVLDLPDDETGAVDLDALPAWLDRERPALAVLSHLASQRGLVQPVAQIARGCHEAGVPVVVDAAQSLGHLRCDDVDADAWVATSRKWLAGPRGVGVLALAPSLASRLELRAPARGPQWQPGDEPVAHRLESHEAHVAGRVGLAVAVAEHLAAGPARIRERLAALGSRAAEVLTVAGWQPAAGQGGSAIVSMVPPPGVDPFAVCRALRTVHALLTTYAGPDRAPRDHYPPLLRVSPHVDATEDDLAAAADALTEVTRALA
ncbi:MAG TPA: aminotransferase class V-fold PLP-dependent enzyme [Mycobacteriales bacterium]